MEPEIPQNTGNIGRTCVGTNSSLHLIEPLGFEINDRQLKRAGLDYWPELDFHIHSSWDSWLQGVKDLERVFLFTTKTKKIFYEETFQSGDWFVFGKETKGLDESLRIQYSDRCLTLPMIGPIRSYNLANAVSMVLGEGIRQTL